MLVEIHKIIEINEKFLNQVRSLHNLSPQNPEKIDLFIEPLIIESKYNIDKRICNFFS